MNDEGAAFIKLDQFLKREGIASTGGHAKALIQGGEVKVDGTVETRRGRKLRGGERVEVEGLLLRVSLGEEENPGERA